MPDPTNQPTTTAAPTTNDVRVPVVPPEQKEALDKLRERLGLGGTADPPPAAAAVTPAAPVAAATQTPSEESVLRALAEEQLRLSRERRAFDDERKKDGEAKTAAQKRLERLDRIERALKSGNRRGVVSALYDDKLPENELGEWGKEMALAMSGEPVTVTPDDVERMVARRLEEERNGEKLRLDKEKQDHEAVRTDANQNYLRALDTTLRSLPAKYPGLNRFGVDGAKVIKLVEESFATSKGTGVIPVADVLDKLESELKTDIEATPYGQKQQPPGTPPGSTQPSINASTTLPAQEKRAQSLDEIEAEARKRILEKAWELQKQQRAR